MFIQVCLMLKVGLTTNSFHLKGQVQMMNTRYERYYLANCQDEHALFALKTYEARRAVHFYFCIRQMHERVDP